MSPEAQRIAIAEVTGWKWFLSPCNNEQNVLARSQEEANKIKLGGWIWELTPDYLNNLNAMHEAEKTLPADESADGHWGYIGHLIEVTKAESMEMHREVFIVAHATAAQRAEAFLRTLSLWDDSK